MINENSQLIDKQIPESWIAFILMTFDLGAIDASGKRSAVLM